MKKRHVISIAGRLGSGKSTVSKLLAKKLGYEHNYAGALMRKLAADRGLSFEEYHALMGQDPNFDRYVDEKQREFIESNDQVIAEGHVAFHVAPYSFKVFLDVNPHIAAQRVFDDLRNNPLRKVEDSATTLEQVEKNLEERLQSNVKRWKEMYGFNYLDFSNYDCVIDTTTHSPEEIVRSIADQYRVWLEA